MLLLPGSLLGKGGGGLAPVLDAQPATFAAYSARRLSSAYAGPLLRIRRSSDNAEQDIGFAGANLDVAGATAFIAGGSGFISKWYDQSGNARDAAQATAANQPQIVLTLAALNNRPAVLFGEASAFALATASISASIFGSGGFSSSVIDYTTNPTQQDRLFQHGNGIDFAISTGSKLTLNVAATTTTGAFVDTTSLTQTAHIVDMLYSSAALTNVPTIAVDGGTRTLTNTSPTGTILAESGPITTGNFPAVPRGFPGYMAENLFFATQPSAGQLAALRANQKAYWGTP